MFKQLATFNSNLLEHVAKFRFQFCQIKPGNSTSVSNLYQTKCLSGRRFLLGHNIYVCSVSDKYGHVLSGDLQGFMMCQPLCTGSHAQLEKML